MPLPQKITTNNVDIERLYSSHQQLLESQEGMIKSVVSYTASSFRRYPSIAIDAPIDGVTNEDFIGLKMKVAELQTELGVERNRSNKKEAIVVSLLEENHASKHFISDLQDEVSQLKRDSDEMVSHLMSLICELNRLKECPKISDARTDLSISMRLCNPIAKVISALAEEENEENEGWEGAQTNYRPPRRSAMSAPEDVEDNSNNVSLHKRYSSSPDLKVDAAMVTPPAPAFRNMLRRFNSSKLLSRLPSDGSTKSMTSEQSGTRCRSTSFGCTVPFLSCSPSEKVIISQPKSQRRPRCRSYVDDDLDGSQRYLNEQNTVAFPGDESKDDTMDVFRPLGKRRSLSF